MNQDVLYNIVQTWNLNPQPEYRGFRCANCQEYMHKAWHHWMTSGGYATPVHLCDKCENLYRSGKLEAVKPKQKVRVSKFVRNLPAAAEREIAALLGTWRLSPAPSFKTFACDKCGSSVRKAYHVWSKPGSKLVEAHFCKSCGDPLFA